MDIIKDIIHFQEYKFNNSIIKPQLLHQPCKLNLRQLFEVQEVIVVSGGGGFFVLFCLLLFL